MKNPMNLTGQRILITGASRGIGRACAVLLADLGAQLVLVARNREQLENLCVELPGDGHLILPCDLSNPAAAENLVETACTGGEKLTGVLYAAGIGPALPLKAVDMEEMQRVFNTNFFSFMILAKTFIKPRYSNGGSLVVISSVSGMAGWQGLSVYGASKGALNAAVKSLAVELAPRNYRVNAVVPSNIKTDMLSEMLKVLSPEEVEKIAAKQPLGFGEPQDVANAAAFLLSSAGRFITGTALVVDGGYLAL